MKFWFAFSLITLSLTACQNIQEITDKKFPCNQLDWYELGRASGVQGKESVSYETTAATCLEFNEEQHQRFINGWYAGIDEYCTELNGFALGRSGQTYTGLCPKSRESLFLSGYEKGQTIYRYEVDNQKLSSQMQQLSQTAANADSDAQKVLQKKITQLETQLELNRALISRIQDELNGATNTL